MAHVAYVETLDGIYRETDGVVEGPFTREELNLQGQYLPQCQVLRGDFEEGVSLSFGFGAGAKADNRFE